MTSTLPLSLLDSMRDTARLRLECADAVAWLQSLQPESVDLIVTDPAYESLEKHRAKGTTTRLKHSAASSNDWFAIFPNTRMEELLRGMYRALKQNTHCYVLCDQETGFFLRDLNARLDLFTFHKAIIWDKVTIGMGYHWRARHEWILFFEKGKRRLNDLGEPDVLTVPRVRNGYPTEKPVELLAKLIRNSSTTGEIVADPFCGSGSCGEAALSTERRFWGCDVSASAVEKSLARLARFTP